MTLPQRTIIVTTKRDLSAALYWCAILILIWAMQLPVKAESRVDGKEAGQVWAAVAPGVVEPRSGQIKIAASVVGRVSEVLVKINDKVATDEPLLQLDDEDAHGRVASAQAQVAMREKARNEKKGIFGSAPNLAGISAVPAAPAQAPQAPGSILEEVDGALKPADQSAPAE